ncbi:MAG: META domain-containing protein [Chloroflexota bacterium]
MNVTKTLISIFVVLLVGILSMGCIDASGQLDGFSRSSSIELEGTNWQLRAFALADAWLEVLPDTEITLNFADSQVTGSAGCNHYFGTYTLSGNKLTVTEPGSTLMGCEDHILQQEIIFLEALSAAESVTLEENSLWITYGENVALVLDPHQPLDPGGLSPDQGNITGQIVVRNMIDYIALPSGATITVQLEDVSLADAPSIVLSERIYTDIEQLPLRYDLSYDVNAIQEGHSYAVSARIEDAQGSLIFINDTMHPVLTHGMRNNTDIELIMVESITDQSSLITRVKIEDTSWQLQGFSSGDVWLEILPNTEIMVEFADGRISGSAGCNRFFGAYTLTDDEFSVGDLGSTRRACAEDIMQQERTFFGLLRDAQRVSLEGKTLMIHASGTSSLIFDR